MNAEDLSRKFLKGLPKTVHGGQAWKLSGVDDFSHNLNPLGPPKCISDIVMNAVSGVDHYPDDSCAELKSVIANTFSVKTSNVIVGAGSSDLIRMFPNTFLYPGCKVILPHPSFAEYSHQCRLVGAEIIEMPLSSKDMRIDTDLLYSLISKDVRAVYICNPNNPTGRIEPKNKVLSIVEECQNNNIFVFLDETLLELVSGHERLTCASAVNHFDNLIVISSLTKSFAIPGIRVGFGLASEGMVNEMEKVRMTWNLGHIEQEVATSLLRDHMDHVKKAADMMHTEAEWMQKELESAGLLAEPTDSFFFFTSLEPTGMSVRDFKEGMLKEKIMIRDCGSFGKPFDSYIRFCVKDRARNEMFVKAVKKVLKGKRN